MNGREVPLPFASAALTVRRASSSFLLLQAFGTHVLWGLETPAAYITLQPVFANKVSPAGCCYPLAPSPGTRAVPERSARAAGAGALRHLQLGPAG